LSSQRPDQKQEDHMRFLPTLAVALFAAATATPAIAQQASLDPTVATPAPPVEQEDEFPWGLLGLLGLAGLLGARRHHDNHVAARRT
jgi:MYXO-CTERM domain-containing protein